MTKTDWKTKKTNWRFVDSSIAERAGFQWIKAKINRFDHQRLELIHINLLRQQLSTTGITNKAEYRERYKEFHRLHGFTPVTGETHRPPPRRDGKRIGKMGWHIEVIIDPWDIPSGARIALPPLYRRPGGLWEAAADTHYAVTWDNEVLDAYWALWAAEPDSKLCKAWAKEHKQQRAMFGRLVDISRGTGDTEYLMIEGSVHLRSVDDAIVFGVAKHCFHWLRHTKQIPGRQSRHARDHFAGELLAAYRKAMSAERRRNAKRGLPEIKTKKTFPGFPGQE